MKPTLKQGQAVQHKTGGPIMIVDAVFEPQEGETQTGIVCSWWSNGVFETMDFGHDSVNPVSVPTQAA
jgi:uncharacterized protein YodC (DUF2158 family)